jgi:hypothetical protein
MRDFETIILGFTWGFALAVFAAILWAVYHWDLFPRKRLRNKLFSDVEIGQTFYDYGGEEMQLREYVKTGELEAKCMSVSGNPLVGFDKADVVKIEVFSLKI